MADSGYNSDSSWSTVDDDSDEKIPESFREFFGDDATQKSDERLKHIQDKISKWVDEVNEKDSLPTLRQSLTRLESSFQAIKVHEPDMYDIFKLVYETHRHLYLMKVNKEEKDSKAEVEKAIEKLGRRDSSVLNIALKVFFVSVIAAALLAAAFSLLAFSGGLSVLGSFMLKALFVWSPAKITVVSAGAALSAGASSFWLTRQREYRMAAGEFANAAEASLKDNKEATTTSSNHQEPLSSMC